MTQTWNYIFPSLYEQFCTPYCSPLLHVVPFDQGLVRSNILFLLPTTLELKNEENFCVTRHRPLPMKTL